MSLHPAAAHLQALFHARQPIRAGSLVVTIFGDCVAPRGGSLAFASLLAITRAVGIADGVVRTAASRLAAEGWLLRERVGRGAFYRLAGPGHAAFEAATRRIYAGSGARWDGGWDMVVLLADAAARAGLRATLEEAGFGALAPSVLVRPRSDLALPWPDLRPGAALRLNAEGENGALARRLTGEVWPLDRIASGWRHLLDNVAPAAAALQAGPTPDPLSAMVARVLLIHEYRRLVLRDPQLPTALLPEPWPGTAARRLCGQLYGHLVPPAERWLDANGSCAAGPLPPPDAAFHARFAG